MANNGAPFMVERNYSCRSLLLLTRNLSFDSSQKQCVVCQDVDQNDASLVPKNRDAFWSKAGG
jgi:hypothetical protein